MIESDPTAASWTNGTTGDVIASIRGGFSVECEDRPAVQGEQGVLKTSAVLHGQLDLTQQKFVPPSQYRRLRTPLRAEAIVLCRKNSEDVIGACAFVEGDYPSLFLSDLLWEIKTRPEAEPRWLLSILQSPEVRQAIRIRATGTQQSMKNISHDKLLSIPIKIPPRDAQRRIADILGTWNQAIEVAESATLGIGRSLNDLLIRLLDRSVDQVQWSASGLLRVKLGQIFGERIESGDATDRLLSVTGNDGVIDREDVERRDTSSEDKSKYKLVMPGDIAYNTMRMWQGVAGLSSLKGIVSPAYTVVTPVFEQIDPTFAAYLFKAPRMIHRFHQYSQGLVDDTLSLKYPQFAAIEVAIPAILDQRRIVNVLDGVSNEIRLRHREVEALQLQRDALASELLSGRLRVPEIQLPLRRRTEAPHLW